MKRQIKQICLRNLQVLVSNDVQVLVRFFLLLSEVQEWAHTSDIAGLLLQMPTCPMQLFVGTERDLSGFKATAFPKPQRQPLA